MVLYGVVQVGNLKKAYVRLSHVLAGSLPQPKEGRAHELTVGQQLGPFYAVQEIAADRLVLAAPGVTYTATFGKKTDRPAPLPVAPPSQAAVELARPTPTFVPDPSTQPAVGSAPAMPAGSPPGAPAAGTAVVGTTPPPTAAPAPAPPQVSGRTLLEAIEAARAAQQAGLMPASPPNPFAGK